MTDDTKPLTIGQLARQAGIGVETVRFYERQGLIEDPPRRRSGYRQYPPNSVARLSFIRETKSLGFSLEEIRQLLLIHTDSSSSCNELRKCVAAKIAEVDEKIAALHRIRTALETMAAVCDNNPPSSPCPILDALERGRKN